MFTHWMWWSLSNLKWYDFRNTPNLSIREDDYYGQLYIKMFDAVMNYDKWDSNSVKNIQ